MQLLEPLEDRRLLAARALDPTFGGDGIVTTDLGTLGAAANDVAFMLEVTDESGRVRSSFEAGERLYLNILVEDQRADSRGVFVGALDLLFDDSLVVLDGTITFGPSFPNLPNAKSDTPGVLDEVSAMGGFTPPGPGPMLLVQVPFFAQAPGRLTFSTNPADDLPMHEVLVHGWNYSIPSDRIDYGSTTIDISGSTAIQASGPPSVLFRAPIVYSDSELAEIARQMGDPVVQPVVLRDTRPVEPVPAGSTAGSLKTEDTQILLSETAARWAAADEDASTLGNVTDHIAELAGGLLGRNHDADDVFANPLDDVLFRAVGHLFM